MPHSIISCNCATISQFTVFRKITDKLFPCKQVRNARKKILPTLIAMYRELNERDMTERRAMINNESDARSFEANASKIIVKMGKLLSDPKCQKEYQAFFKTMERIFVEVGVAEMTKIMRFTDPNRPLLGSEIRVEDLCNAYAHLNFNGRIGDLHVLCASDDNSTCDWDYSLIRSKFRLFLDETDFKHKSQIAEAIVKEVLHPDPLCF